MQSTMLQIPSTTHDLLSTAREWEREKKKKQVKNTVT